MVLIPFIISPILFILHLSLPFLFLSFSILPFSRIQMSIILRKLLTHCFPIFPHFEPSILQIQITPPYGSSKSVSRLSIFSDFISLVTFFFPTLWQQFLTLSTSYSPAPLQLPSLLSLNPPSSSPPLPLPPLFRNQHICPPISGSIIRRHDFFFLGIGV